MIPIENNADAQQKELNNSSSQQIKKRLKIRKDRGSSHFNQKQQREFILDGVAVPYQVTQKNQNNQSAIQYDSLQDRHLVRFFERKTTYKSLIRQGIIDKKGAIIDRQRNNLSSFAIYPHQIEKMEKIDKIKEQSQIQFEREHSQKKLHIISSLVKFHGKKRKSPSKDNQQIADSQQNGQNTTATVTLQNENSQILQGKNDQIIAKKGKKINLEYIKKTGDPYGSMNYTTIDLRRDRLFYNKDKDLNSSPFNSVGPQIMKQNSIHTGYNSIQTSQQKQIISLDPLQPRPQQFSTIDQTQTNNQLENSSNLIKLPQIHSLAQRFLSKDLSQSKSPSRAILELIKKRPNKNQNKSVMLKQHDFNTVQDTSINQIKNMKLNLNANEVKTKTIEILNGTTQDKNLNITPKFEVNPVSKEEFQSILEKYKSKVLRSSQNTNINTQ
eukprot:403344082